MVQAEVGSISSGTLRPDDLARAFTDELERLAPAKAAELRAEYAEAYKFLDGQRPLVLTVACCDLAELADVLQDALEELAPEGCYFGTLEGDGADFGFWPVQE